MEMVLRDDIFTAWSNFRDHVDDDYSFEDFVGYPLLIKRLIGDTHTYFDLSDHAASRIAILLGPHRGTMIKAWCIQHGK